jgi:predicted tellurium resistance membrane protein TerC
MDWLSDPQIWIGLVTLTVLEIVLGIDNIIFISILCGKLPAQEGERARKLGLTLALVMRVLLLLSLGWVMSLKSDLFRIPGIGGAPGGISGRDLILVGGGLFLIAKSVHEIHGNLEGEEGHVSQRVVPSFSAVIGQIIALDLVFSLDSVITAVGMVNNVPVMIAAVVIAMVFMLAFSGSVGAFVHRHPTVKMLALAFLVLIGVNLLAEGFDQHINKGYTYFAMAFAVMVEMLNLRLRRQAAEPVHLHYPVAPGQGTAKVPPPTSP